jgi:hypothetical protein
MVLPGQVPLHVTLLQRPSWGTGLAHQVSSLHASPRYLHLHSVLVIRNKLNDLTPYPSPVAINNLSFKIFATRVLLLFFSLYLFFPPTELLFQPIISSAIYRSLQQFLSCGFLNSLLSYILHFTSTSFPFNQNIPIKNSFWNTVALS